MLDAVRRAIQDHRLMPTGTRIIVGVSGGTDSLALLHVLAKLQPTLGVSLHVATYDHGWRGNQGNADTQFVADFAGQLGLPVTTGRAGAPPPTANREAAARRARYDFLASAAREVGAGVIAVGHHADDQAETVLMRLLRGAGSGGLAGMRYHAPTPGHPSLTLVRPLLGIPRAVIDAYCAESHLTPRHDPTNDDPNYLRNHIRLEVLPQLEAVNPGLRQTLAHLAEISATEHDFIGGIVNDLLAAHAKDKNGRWLLARGPFQGWHVALQRRAVRKLALRFAGHAEIGYEHVVEAARLAVAGRVGDIAVFPGGVQMRVGYKTLMFERMNMITTTPTLWMPPDAVYSIQLNSSLNLPSGKLSLTTNTPDSETMGTFYPPAKPFIVRTRRPGDRITPPGMEGHTKSVKKWMIDRKIPAEHRNCIPLLWVDGSLVAVLHLTSGVVAHPYHTTGPARQKRYALQWQSLSEI